MPQPQRLSDLDQSIEIRIVPTSLRWPGGDTIAWKAARECVEAMRAFAKVTDAGATAAEENADLSPLGIRKARAVLGAKALRELAAYQLSTKPRRPSRTISHFSHPRSPICPSRPPRPAKFPMQWKSATFCGSKSHPSTTPSSTSEISACWRLSGIHRCPTSSECLRPNSTTSSTKR